MTNFGDNIRALRKARELTQEELADFLGVTFQAVSKWERSTTFPDVPMLPKIAAFFDTTVDHLLGVDHRLREAKIEAYLDEYARLWAADDLPTLLDRLKAAMHEFPGDYRIIVRYFNALIANAIRSGDPAAVRHEAETLYASIADHCTIDKIRIWSQKLMADYYSRLTHIAGSDVTVDHVGAILENMPLMQNGRDFLATTLLEGNARITACANAACELAYLLLGAAMSRCEAEQEAEPLERAIAVVQIIFPDGDYGKCYPGIIRAYRMLARVCHAAGQDEQASAALTQAADIAARYDAIAPDATLTHTSPMVRGLAVVKYRIPFEQGRAQLAEVERLAQTLGLALS